MLRLQISKNLSNLINNNNLFFQNIFFFSPLLQLSPYSFPPFFFFFDFTVYLYLSLCPPLFLSPTLPLKYSCNIRSSNCSFILCLYSPVFFSCFYFYFSFSLLFLFLNNFTDFLCTVLALPSLFLPYFRSIFQYTFHQVIKHHYFSVFCHPCFRILHSLFTFIILI